MWLVHQSYDKILNCLLQTVELSTNNPEQPNNYSGPPSPLMLQLMEIGFSRTSVELAFKKLGKS